MTMGNQTQSLLTHPALVTRVGCVGHRFTRDSARLASKEIPGLTSQLQDVYAALEAAAAAIHHRHASVFSPSVPVTRLVSSLASGADLVAQQALPDAWPSEIILPMPAARFRLDFPVVASEAEPHSRTVFDNELERLTARPGTRILTLPDPGSDPTPGYGSASAMILANCDILIAVWDGDEQNRADCDGKPAAMLKPAGTAWTMREAVRRSIPTVWLDLASGKARFVTASAEPTRLFAVDEVDCRAGPLGERLEDILAPPGSMQGHGGTSNVLLQLDDALNETERSGSRRFAYDALVRLLSGRVPRLYIPFRPMSERAHEWDDYLASAPQASGPLAQTLKEVLLPRFAAFDTLAQVYGHSYRSAYVAVFLLSALAVFVGLLSLFDWGDASPVAVKGWAALGELVLISAIILIVRSGRRRRSHQRWLDYRALAETLRHLRFLSMVGAAGAAPRTTRLETPGPDSWRSETWQLWYARATIRQLGLPTGDLSPEYCWQLLQQVREGDLAEQASYHRANHHNLHQVHHRLHEFGDFLFGSTAGVLLAFFLVPWFIYATGLATWLGSTDAAVFAYLKWVKPYVTLLGASLPALGGALAGIRVHGDFEGFALRSERTAGAIHSLTLELLQEQGHADLAGTTRVLQACARVMSDDIEAWEALYGRKTLVFPA